MSLFSTLFVFFCLFQYLLHTISMEPKKLLNIFRMSMQCKVLLALKIVAVCSHAHNLTTVSRSMRQTPPNHPRLMYCTTPPRATPSLFSQESSTEHDRYHLGSYTSDEGMADLIGVLPTGAAVVPTASCTGGAGAGSEADAVLWPTDVVVEW